MPRLKGQKPVLTGKPKEDRGEALERQSTSGEPADGGREGSRCGRLAPCWDLPLRSALPGDRSEPGRAQLTGFGKESEAGESESAPSGAV